MEKVHIETNTVQETLVIPLYGRKMCTDRIRNYGCDLNDLSWFDAVDGDEGVCFMAAGVFYYFQKNDLKRLFPAMARRFPGGKQSGASRWSV